MSALEPTFSIVMPVFNSDRWLAEAIASIQAQTHPDFELIIVDDGSEDRTGSIVAEAIRDDSRIRTERQAHLGIAEALNRGISLARAQIIVRMDGDDVAAPDRLRTQLAFLEAHPDVLALGSWAQVIDEAGRTIGERKPETEPAALHRFLTKQNPFIHSSMMFRASAIRRVGGYRPVLEGAEDYDLWLRLSEHGRLANVPEFLLHYRAHAASVSAAAARKQILAARLARLSAAARRASRPDFVDKLDAPLALAALRREDALQSTAEFYDLLGRPADGDLAAGDFRRFARIDLNHAERKAAQSWLKDVLVSHRRAAIRSTALLWLVRLNPLRGLSLIWSAFRGR